MGSFEEFNQSPESSVSSENRQESKAAGYGKASKVLSVSPRQPIQSLSVTNRRYRKRIPSLAVSERPTRKILKAQSRDKSPGLTRELLKDCRVPSAITNPNQRPTEKVARIPQRKSELPALTQPNRQLKGSIGEKLYAPKETYKLLIAGHEQSLVQKSSRTDTQPEKSKSDFLRSIGAELWQKQRLYDTRATRFRRVNKIYENNIIDQLNREAETDRMLIQESRILIQESRTQLSVGDEKFLDFLKLMQNVTESYLESMKCISYAHRSLSRKMHEMPIYQDYADYLLQQIERKKRYMDDLKTHGHAARAWRRVLVTATLPHLAMSWSTDLITQLNRGTVAQYEIVMDMIASVKTRHLEKGSVIGETNGRWNALHLQIQQKSCTLYNEGCLRWKMYLKRRSQLFVRKILNQGSPAHQRAFVAHWGWFVHRLLRENYEADIKDLQRRAKRNRMTSALLLYLRKQAERKFKVPFGKLDPEVWKITYYYCERMEAKGLLDAESDLVKDILKKMIRLLRQLSLIDSINLRRGLILGAARMTVPVTEPIRIIRGRDLVEKIVHRMKKRIDTRGRPSGKVMSSGTKNIVIKAKHVSFNFRRNKTNLKPRSSNTAHNSAPRSRTEASPPSEELGEVHRELSVHCKSRSDMSSRTANRGSRGPTTISIKDGLEERGLAMSPTSKREREANLSSLYYSSHCRMMKTVDFGFAYTRFYSSGQIHERDGDMALSMTDEPLKPVSQDSMDRSSEAKGDPFSKIDPVFSISPQKLREAMSASPNSDAAYWTYELYRGPDNEKVLVHYCRNRRVSEIAAQLFLNENFLGLDIEWKPQSTTADGIKKNMALIQLASERRIALFHIALFKGQTLEELVPPTLRHVLESTDIIKVGVSILADSTRLRKYLGIQSRGLLELSHLYKVVKFSLHQPEKMNKRLVSLSQQVEEFLQLPISKGAVRESDWSSELGRQQVTYAASDAYANLRLLFTYESTRKALAPIPRFPEFAELKLPLPTISKQVEDAQKNMLAPISLTEQVVGSSALSQTVNYESNSQTDENLKLQRPGKVIMKEEDITNSGGDNFSEESVFREISRSKSQEVVYPTLPLE